MRVIGVVGLAGSGKGEIGEVARESGIPVVTMGDVIREACRRRGLDPAEHHGAVASALREEEGPLAIAERTLPRIRAASEDSETNTVIVDGLRSDDELDRFREEFGECFELVAIEAPFETRAERITARGRDDTARETLAQRDERERGFGMDAAIDRADHAIENAASLDAFHDRIRDLLAADADAADGEGTDS